MEERQAMLILLKETTAQMAAKPLPKKYVVMIRGFTAHHHSFVVSRFMLSTWRHH